jgi:hypothetical protein
MSIQFSSDGDVTEGHIWAEWSRIFLRPAGSLGPIPRADEPEIVNPEIVDPGLENPGIGNPGIELVMV